MQDEAAPTAADVEHALALLELELRADELELRALGLLETRGAPGEERAAIGHGLVEEQREELVGDVVVVTDGPAVALAAMAAPPRAQLAGGDPRRRRQAARLGGRERETQPPATVDRGRLERVEEADHAIEVVRLELPAGVGASEAELAGSAQQVRDGCGRAHGEAGGLRSGGGELRAIPEAHAERPVRQGLLEGAPQGRGAGEWHRVHRLEAGRPANPTGAQARLTSPR